MCIRDSSRSEAGVGVVALGGEVVAIPGGGSPRAVLDDVLDRLATWTIPKRVEATEVLEGLAPLLSGVSTAVLVTADRDRAPGEVPEPAAMVAERLRERGIGVCVAVLVDEESAAGTHGDVVRVPRGIVERLDPIRL